ncbi:unnamed protein product [Nesidiocoris tenuis]|uniref:Uncharacterized protein n=1 Tax=Nesidiocoris tenuis TaxID=355587 RepID=A0A6H5FZ70_9HEMI|nr:unnamed protein product [Nesidiocoris tenuis]
MLFFTKGYDQCIEESRLLSEIGAQVRSVSAARWLNILRNPLFWLLNPLFREKFLNKNFFLYLQYTYR